MWNVRVLICTYKYTRTSKCPCPIMQVHAYLDCYISLVYLVSFCLAMVSPLHLFSVLPYGHSYLQSYMYLNFQKPLLNLYIMLTCNWYGYLVAQSAMLIPMISCTPSLLYLHFHTFQLYIVVDINNNILMFGKLHIDCGIKNDVTDYICNIFTKDHQYT